MLSARTDSVAKYYLSLEAAETAAAHLVEAFSESCKRIEIAGSIRRRRRLVKDIELVAIPKRGCGIRQGELFQSDDCNLLKLRIDQMIKDGADIQVVSPGRKHLSSELTDDGKWWGLWLPRINAPVDIFLCTEETWGVTLAFRTGSAEFNKGLVNRARSIRSRFEGSRLRDRLGRAVPTPEEDAVFRHLWVKPVPPDGRHDASDVQAR